MGRRADATGTWRDGYEDLWQNAIQAATEHDTRLTAIQQHVNQEGFRPSASRDARAAAIIARAIAVQLTQQFIGRNGLARGGRARGRGRGRGDMRGGRGGRGGRGSRGGRTYPARGGGRRGRGSGGIRGGRGRGHGATQGAGVNPAGQRTPSGQHEGQEPAPSRGTQRWATAQTLQEMADAGFPAGRARPAS
ncbi:hypothetical protein N7447_003381 [Penicillium robsamsonii]|uniref:uncharacterized protein n=1 Tax=Penicillium robsamsonii TaxID=1792511 RepID=UPI002547C257|nr:uncharacterized protein N7447_003381 [Penicillium robsamsonii]KAJ5826618.1 hypothetical protein N7447_003381 [Penicillium robsamsonii]